MGNFMLYKSIATYPANSRGLKSQLLIEIRNKDCSIRRIFRENFVHYSLTELKFNWDHCVKNNYWYPNLKRCWLRCIKGLKKGDQKKNDYFRESVWYCNMTHRRSECEVDSSLNITFSSDDKSRCSLYNCLLFILCSPGSPSLPSSSKSSDLG